MYLTTCTKLSKMLASTGASIRTDLAGRVSVNVRAEGTLDKAKLETLRELGLIHD